MRALLRPSRGAEWPFCFWTVERAEIGECGGAAGVPLRLLKEHRKRRGRGD